jgi:hypothetical protein
MVAGTKKPAKSLWGTGGHSLSPLRERVRVPLNDGRVCRAKYQCTGLLSSCAGFIVAMERQLGGRVNCNAGARNAERWCGRIEDGGAPGGAPPDGG